MVHKPLEEWLGILSPRLRKLLDVAKSMAWPFVPEEWQYIDDENLTEEQTVNLKDLILSKNAIRDDLKECDVLMECVDSAIDSDDFPTAAAALFLIDRFMYWFGGSPTLLRLIATIEESSPDTPIAPQIMIRKARVKKDRGQLQEAEIILNKITNTCKGKWVYQDEHQYNLVCAVCVQIKGVIRYNLGLWHEAAHYILDSIIGYNSLPIPDKKGISSSLGILSEIYKNMSPATFAMLKREYNLQNCVWHPLLEGYSSGKEAARLGRHEKLYFCRHLRRATINLWLYISIISGRNTDQQQQLQQTSFQQALADIIRSCEKFKDLNDFTSKEQAFEMVSAVFYVYLTLKSINEHHEDAISIEQRKSIEEVERFGEICVVLYQDLCTTESPFRFSDRAQDMIIEAFHRMGHKTFHNRDTEGTVKCLVPVSEPRPTDHFAYPYRAGADLDVEFNQLSIKGSNTSDGVETVMEKRVADSENKIGVADPSATTVSSTSDYIISSDESSATNTTNESDTSSIHTKSTDESSLSSGYTFSSASSSLSSVDKSHKDIPKLQHGSSEPFSQDSHAQVKPDSVEQDFLDGTIDPASIDVNDDLEVSAERYGLYSLNITADEAKMVQRGSIDGAIKMGVSRAILWKYNPEESMWSTQPTLLYVGEEIKVATKGAQRDVYNVQYLEQEEPLSRYAGKVYRVKRPIRQYQQDVVCQMTARYYTALFNKALLASLQLGSTKSRETRVTSTQIQFLPVVHVQTITENGELGGYMNIEPFVDETFIKITNNATYRNVKLDDGLATAFSHFSYVESGGKLMVVDLQGWLGKDNDAVVLLTDPQIHSETFTHFGSSNHGKRGFKAFWEKVHPECSHVCKQLGIDTKRGH
ncbi:unnamed protein product [Owenia fusiformis]|uniref:Uncharacterized protein n=1 Tax=Owenia fusiformis TaxID=6347 RepID=A0A8J1THX9_OWEFU|nr:unnamed protein product [Owenia fusiformis]